MIFLECQKKKTLGSLGKIRVGQETGNTHILFFGLAAQVS